MSDPGLLSNVVGYFFDKAQQQNEYYRDIEAKKEERAYNEKQTVKDRAWQLYLWNLQNEYNLPINQRKRLEDAGINPNLAFGSSASTMSAPVGSPITGHPTSNEGMSNRRIERASTLAQIANLREITRRERNNNNLFEYLLEDKKEHDRLRYKSDMLEYEWNLAHKADALNEDLNAKRLGNQLTQTRNLLLEKQRELIIAQINHEWKKVDALKQEMAHLAAKYDFEDNFYRRGLNPYETSTIAGAIRTGQGLLRNGYRLGKDWLSGFKLMKKSGLSTWQALNGYR